uniref:alpha-2Db adrenergic receptor-like isoform X2 n=1 Tax=Ciona intestinalis TaxID=7719 RepID=UPI000EF46777|nr:alpha-2Db adrenergic receptor-like isoform X2 [Ciona intestinalis]|eukprot:XP_026691768.1 alpha-2Db adrenergic receptor-like isoform X2 [Ciona intestinalis]
MQISVIGRSYFLFGQFPLSTWLDRQLRQTIISLLVSILIFVIVLGNFLIVAAVYNFKHLRTTQYFYVCSLATSDLLLGVLVIPLNLVREMYGYWPLGETICKIHLSLDILLCTASIWNLCMISISRWWILSAKSCSFLRSIPNRLCIFMVVCVWMWSALVCAWSFDAYQQPIDQSVCKHSQMKWYAIFSSCSSFYVPLIIMCLAYGKISCILKDQAQNTQLRRFVLYRQKKLHLTTGLIMGAFVFCWFPFFQAHLTQILCPTCCVPASLLNFLAWLGYCNSALTPIIYTTKRSELRKAFCILLRNKRACENAYPSLYAASITSFRMAPFTLSPFSPASTNLPRSIRRNTESRLSFNFINEPTTNQHVIAA